MPLFYKQMWKTAKLCTTGNQDDKLEISVLLLETFSVAVWDRVLIFLTTEIYNIRLNCIINNVVYKY